MATITGYRTRDFRAILPEGAGSDAIHTDPEYGYAVVILETDIGVEGTGLTYTLGGGTELICQAIELLVEAVVGQELEALMSEFGQTHRGIAEHHRIRWLGPHKGVIHAALASITNAAYDLWAKSRGVPLWRLLLDLEPEAIVRLIDFSYLEDVLDADSAQRLIEDQLPTRNERAEVLRNGYPGYDTSVGWFAYSDRQLRENAIAAVDAGFTAMKLKVGSYDYERDIRRVALVREAVAGNATIMLDANQAYGLPRALAVCREFAALEPFWIEEPTQPDDVLAHRTIAEAIAPVPVAVGESIHNRVMWKNFLAQDAVGIVQADCTRLAGVSEYLAVSLLCKHYPVRVVPHVGDMGQIHQHLVLFNHIALGHECVFLEHIPHLRGYFRFPARVEGGVYVPPEEPGASTELLEST